jgi:hypothetical protein
MLMEEVYRKLGVLGARGQDRHRHVVVRRHAGEVVEILTRRLTPR